MTTAPAAAAFPLAAHAFRGFFTELRETFLEREALFTQLELALLCREHLLAIGPPGTAKSLIATSVLGRIVDERTGKPSLFSKQLAESTVQTDLIGAVDFKVLTETGRTEYLTEEGMLGSTYAFLDEVFDGRDMLLRSVLNVLHERELKHGRKVTAGKCETAIMTSNRYLSEVLARSPELLVAFADRLSFICFCPKAFARSSSRAAMLDRFAGDQRPDLRARLTLQQLDVLQEAVERVRVPGHITEALELVADRLERELTVQVSKLPDYVPTKYFSQRSLVKGLWALKAAVVRARILDRPNRPEEALPEDLESLRHFFLLGGPPRDETEALLASAVDPRERAQLEIIRLEHRVFDEVLAEVRTRLKGGRAREAEALAPKADFEVAQQLAKSFQAHTAAELAKSLQRKLVPGPRYPQNRRELVSAVRVLAGAFEMQLARGAVRGPEPKGGLSYLPRFAELLELYRFVPELSDRHAAASSGALALCRQALEWIVLSAQGSSFEEAKAESLVVLTQLLDQEIGWVNLLCGAAAPAVPEAAAEVQALEVVTRRRVGALLRQRVREAFTRPSPRGSSAPAETLASTAQRLTEIELALVALAPDQNGIRHELLGPIGVAYAQEAISVVEFVALRQFARVVTAVTEQLRSAGLRPGPVLAEQRELLERRVRAHAESLVQELPSLLPDGEQALNGQAYEQYRERWASEREGEVAALTALESSLAESRPAQEIRFFSAEVHHAIARSELVCVRARVRFLRRWLSQLLDALPSPEKLSGRSEAERAFDKLVKSRFPMLATREGELLRLQTALEAFTGVPGELGDAARKLDQGLREIAADFGTYSQVLLQTRTAVASGR